MLEFVAYIGLFWSLIMTKRMIIMLLSLALLFGLITGWYFFKQSKINEYMKAMQFATATVSTTVANKENWKTFISETGSVVAINGVNVTTQASGIVSAILFKPGSMVHKGDILLDLDDRQLQANVDNAKAQLLYAEQNHREIKELFNVGAASKNSLETTQANLATAQANLAAAEAEISYLHIPAPFDGKIGIHQVNVGQYLQPGTAIASLQQLDPLYVQFAVAQQDLAQIHPDQDVEVSIDTNPNHIYHGKITAIDSTVDPDTRNAQVQATIHNDDMLLLPGMFAQINVLLAQADDVITLPQTAINYNLFGNSVLVAIPEDTQATDGKQIYVLKLQYVSTGEERKGSVAITKGLKGGEIVVNSGQLKVAEGSRVTINNSITP